MRGVLLLALLTLAGCTDEAMRTQALDSQRRDCADYGFKPATDAFARCMQDGANNKAMVMASRPAYRMPDPYMLPPPVQRQNRTQCTSQMIANQVYTNCQ